MEKMIRLEHLNENARNKFVVNWCMGNQCNYKCSYCNSVLNSGDRKWVNIEIVKTFTSELLNHFDKMKIDKKVVFELTGGEITLNDDLIDIIKLLKGLYCETCILTNGSKGIKYWNECKNYLDYCVLSYHADHCHHKHFFEVIDTLVDKVNLYINIMMHPEKFDSCMSLGERISEMYPNIAVSFQPIFENLSSNQVLRNYTESQKTELNGLHEISTNRNADLLRFKYRTQLKSTLSDGTVKICQPEQLINEKTNKFYGWLCWAGCEQIVISQDGDAFRGWCCQDWIGNVHNYKIRFPKLPVMCEKEVCHCNMDIMTKKQLFQEL